VSSAEIPTLDDSNGLFDRRGWCVHDVAALAVFTAAIAVFFWNAVSLRGALFYFDITEINYPYRAFLAEELKAGRFSRWCPGLYCGLPLFSESQAGYLHPFKYLLYPWLPTWQAFNFDTVLSVWLTGVGTYLWLRRHVGPAGALAGSAVFGLSGYVWGHLIHTSMINALASVPFVIWGLEWSWENGRWRGSVLGGLALAVQVFAGHLQDSLLTIGLVMLYGLYRAATEAESRAKVRAMAVPIVLVGMGVLLSAVQWVPSKELLDRSPRAGGLSWRDLTYGSWSPELLPTLVLREAYGTRARDTDWMDGFYPYHEMNCYLGLIAIVLAVVGAGGPAARDRWCQFWVLLVGLGCVLALGKFTLLFDYAPSIPVLGSSREPVRFHLWVSLGIAALVSVGVERLARCRNVSLRGGLVVAGAVVLLSIPIVAWAYLPVWLQPRRWPLSYHLLRYQWLGQELALAAARTLVLASAGWWTVRAMARAKTASLRQQLAALLPLFLIVDLLAAHWFDVPTFDPRYWTDPPETVSWLRADPSLIRIFGVCDLHSGEPGYASQTVDYLPVRDALDWSLPLVWHVPSARGNTPMISRRLHNFTRFTEKGAWRHDIEGASHILIGYRLKGRDAIPVGRAFIHRNPTVLPRARLAGHPVYVDNEEESALALTRLGPKLRDELVVEDPTHPLPPDATVSGTAQIIRDLPEHVVVDTEAAMPAYLVLADTFDPGWSATVDGQPAPIRPAYLAFRAVYLPAGKHEVVFRYRPAGFALGLALSGCGALLALGFWLLPRSSRPPDHEHVALHWPVRWRTWFFAALALIVVASIPIRVPAYDPRGDLLIGPGGRPLRASRWQNSLHSFTWGSGIEAMH
jgi:Bacterial membrane protein YfhO